MTIAFTNSSSASTVGSQTSLTITFPSGTTGDLMVLAIAIEGRAAGSGPYVDESAAGPGTGILGEASGWHHLGTQAPSATGNALDVWVAFNGGTTATINFTGSYAAIAAIAAYENVLAASVASGVIRVASFAQWTGDDSECPAVVMVRREMTVVCSAHQLQSPGYGNPVTPSGFTTRIDAKRGGSFGNVELAIGDKLAVSDGDTGTIAFNTTASSGSTKGATATLAIRPLAEVFAATSPLIAIEYPAHN